jgi:RNA polymerase sigma-70 factor (ECF subfamily)
MLEVSIRDEKTRGQNEQTNGLTDGGITRQGMAVARLDEAKAESPRFETIEELFQALESPLLSYAFRYVQSMEQAEDIVQEAFVKLHRQFAEVREPRRWLFRTVHNLALNQQRNSRKLVPLETNPADSVQSPPETPDPRPLPDEQIARLESIGLVRLCLETLDTRSRELIHLKFNDDLSYKEISARTGLTVGNVGYLLHHALKSIAVELVKTGGMS